MGVCLAAGALVGDRSAGQVDVVRGDPGGPDPLQKDGVGALPLLIFQNCRDETVIAERSRRCAGRGGRRAALGVDLVGAAAKRDGVRGDVAIEMRNAPGE